MGTSMYLWFPCVLLLEGLGLGVHQGSSHQQLLLEGEEAWGKMPDWKGYSDSTLQGTWVCVSDHHVTLAINFPSGHQVSLFLCSEVRKVGSYVQIQYIFIEQLPSMGYSTSTYNSYKSQGVSIIVPHFRNKVIKT